MNTEQRSRGGTTSGNQNVERGTGAMNCESRSRGGQANSVGTVEELTRRLLANQSYTRKELCKACDEGLKSFTKFTKKHFSFGNNALKMQALRRRLQAILWVERWLIKIESGKMKRRKIMDLDTTLSGNNHFHFGRLMKEEYKLYIHGKSLQYTFEELKKEWSRLGED